MKSWMNSHVANERHSMVSNISGLAERNITAGSGNVLITSASAALYLEADDVVSVAAC